MTIVVSECCVYCFAEVAGHSRSYGRSATARERVRRKNSDGSIIIILYPSLTTIYDGHVRRTKTILLLLWLRYNNIMLAAHGTHCRAVFFELFSSRKTVSS